MIKSRLGGNISNINIVLKIITIFKHYKKLLIRMVSVFSCLNFASVLTISA